MSAVPLCFLSTTEISQVFSAARFLLCSSKKSPNIVDTFSLRYSTLIFCISQIVIREKKKTTVIAVYQTGVAWRDRTVASLYAASNTHTHTHTHTSLRPSAALMPIFTHFAVASVATSKLNTPKNSHLASCGSCSNRGPN